PPDFASSFKPIPAVRVTVTPCLRIGSRARGVSSILPFEPRGRTPLVWAHVDGFTSDGGASDDLTGESRGPHAPGDGGAGRAGRTRGGRGAQLQGRALCPPAGGRTAMAGAAAGGRLERGTRRGTARGDLH